MALMKQDFYSQEATMASNIDSAWEVYTNQEREEKERKAAQRFLIYAFDLVDTDRINQQLCPLMHQRLLHKRNNPEYIPGLSPKHLALQPEDMSLNSSSVKGLLANDEVLEMNYQSAKHDKEYKAEYLSYSDRAKYRVHIYQGNFYQNGQLFDTTNLSSHKREGYGAFTINLYGELSIFQHGKGYYHSSMNAGNPVVCAGEICIANGKLIAINTHSGHYTPSLFNIYRTLEHFVEKGIDVSQVKIYTNLPPPEGLHLQEKERIDFSEESYEIPAAIFFYSIKEKLNEALHSILSDIRKYQSDTLKNNLFDFKDSLINSSLTKDRMKIATKIQEIASQLQDELEPEQLPDLAKVKILIQSLKDLEEENEQLSSVRGKKTKSGRVSHNLETFIQQISTLMDLLKKPLDPKIVRSMKSSR
jgi:hypothetical protein